MNKALFVSVCLALITLVCGFRFINSSSELKDENKSNVLTIVLSNQEKPVVIYGETSNVTIVPPAVKPVLPESHTTISTIKNANITTVNGHKFYRTKPVTELRNADYGVSSKKPIRIWTHNGGKRLNTKHLTSTIEAVLQRMPNVKSSKKFTALILETFLIETDLGLADFEKAANRQRNYGIAQFTIPTAKDMIKYLRKTRKDVYRAVMSMYDRKLSLKDNLMRNTPFSIALCAQLYLRCIPDIHPNIHTVKQRATAWKVYYNSIYGKGSINKYISKVTTFRKQNLI